jgi:hypothetical protein
MYITQVAREMRRYNIQLLGICESIWNGISMDEVNKMLWLRNIEKKKPSSPIHLKGGDSE